MELRNPKKAEMENRTSIPVTFQIQPPIRAMNILITWFTEIPVDRVAVISSGPEAIS